MKFLLFLLISFNSFAAINSNEDMNKFLGNSTPINEVNMVKVPTKAYVKSDDCIMFLKDNESYWKFHETDTYKVESIGDGSIKVKKYLFLKNNKNRWSFDENSISIPFANQLNYYKSLCPDEKFKLSNDELKLFKKD